MTIECKTITGTPPSSVPLCTGLIGDVDGDGQVTIVDVMFISQAMSGTRTLTDCQLRLADVNGDGHINAIEQMFMSQYTVGTLTNVDAIARIAKPIPASDLTKPVPVLW